VSSEKVHPSDAAILGKLHMDFAEEYRSLLDAYEAAVASGNPEANGRWFGDDTIFLAPNQSALHGPTAVVSILF
jgi:hypothetical protein